MALGVADQAQLGVVVINQPFPGFALAYATANEVPAGRGAFDSGRVDRSSFYTPPTFEVQPRGGIQQRLYVA